MRDMIGSTIPEWLDAYRGGATPESLVGRLLDRLLPGDVAFISRISGDDLARQLATLAGRRKAAGGLPGALPLYGVPFAVKDNIDVEGLPTTAACPEFAYAPARSAAVVERLVEAGAIVIGKTNLDQFATGLVGTRSPYGAVPNTFDPAYVSGGSSSGSASVVARGFVPFALGTDTAGSGRVPAGLNNIVGLKPTRGALSATGVVPACRTLDCVSVMALTVGDARTVYAVAAGEDPADAYSRRAPAEAAARQVPAHPRFGIPARAEFHGDRQSEAAWQAALGAIDALGATCVPTDFGVLDQVAALLYDGPWVAERYAAIEDIAARRPEAMHPVVREIILRARGFSAADTFRAMYRLAALKRQADALLAGVDALLVPTAPTHLRGADVEADPIRLNSRLGTYTNFVNLLDWSALALPAGFRSDGLPFGITLIAPAWSDLALCELGLRWQRHLPWPRGATGRPLRTEPVSHAQPPERREPAPGHVRLAVVGAHLAGMPLNRELTDRQAVLVERATTSAAYRLYALAGTVPPKPGLARAEAGAPIEVELWDMPTAAFGSFVAGIPAPLGIGTLELADGRAVKGFICEPWALAHAVDITRFGGWRAYLEAAQRG
jgi:allophanate hydrolase